MNTEWPGGLGRNARRITGAIRQVDPPPGNSDYRDDIGFRVLGFPKLGAVIMTIRDNED